MRHQRESTRMSAPVQGPPTKSSATTKALYFIGNIFLWLAGLGAIAMFANHSLDEYVIPGLSLVVVSQFFFGLGALYHHFYDTGGS